MSKQRILQIIAALLSIVAGGVYILNPGWGVLELLPDNAPLVGNLDEAGATALLLWGLHQLGSGKREDTAAMQLPDSANSQVDQHGEA